eukprot:TRINITY_DN3344_c0_g2_i1.p1 TRINITY_DN3344_c0_g2~~TRINITY_DN3344_c0_g2_i1.p1  ORF type:complete len:317 (+),score=72.69 TRINITY_DN3344_c0_g2_i1:129-1079(+)
MGLRRVAALLVVVALLFGVVSATSLPLNPFASRLSALDDSISTFLKLSTDANATSTSFEIEERCSAELTKFDTNNPSISALNAKIQEYTDAFFSAQLERLVTNLHKKALDGSDDEHDYKLRLEIESPATPMFDWKFHELCGSFNGRVCQAQLEFDLRFTVQGNKHAKISVETASARCVPADALSSCMSHDARKSLEADLVASCEKLSHDGIEARSCRVEAACGPTVNHAFISKFGWVHWAVIALITVISLAIFGAIVRRIVRCVRNRRALKCAQKQCITAKGAKVPSDDAEAGTPLVMMVQTPNGATYMTPYPYSQ